MSWMGGAGGASENRQSLAGDGLPFGFEGLVGAAL
jgi:hypothetical protein